MCKYIHATKRSCATETRVHLGLTNIKFRRGHLNVVLITSMTLTSCNVEGTLNRMNPKKSCPLDDTFPTYYRMHVFRDSFDASGDMNPEILTV